MHGRFHTLRRPIRHITFQLSANSFREYPASIPRASRRFAFSLFPIRIFRMSRARLASSVDPLRARDVVLLGAIFTYFLATRGVQFANGRDRGKMGGARSMGPAKKPGLAKGPWTLGHGRLLDALSLEATFALAA